MYHVFALCRCTSCSAVANTRWRWPLTVRSFCRKFSGMCCSSRLKLRSVGSVGLRLWLSLLASVMQDKAHWSILREGPEKIKK